MYVGRWPQTLPSVHNSYISQGIFIKLSQKVCNQVPWHILSVFCDSYIFARITALLLIYPREIHFCAQPFIHFIRDFGQTFSDVLSSSYCVLAHIVANIFGKIMALCFILKQKNTVLYISQGIWVKFSQKFCHQTCALMHIFRQCFAIFGRIMALILKLYFNNVLHFLSNFN